METQLYIARRCENECVCYQCVSCVMAWQPVLNVLSVLLHIACRDNFYLSLFEPDVSTAMRSWVKAMTDVFVFWHLFQRKHKHDDDISYTKLKIITLNTNLNHKNSLNDDIIFSHHLCFCGEEIPKKQTKIIGFLD